MSFFRLAAAGVGVELLLLAKALPLARLFSTRSSAACAATAHSVAGAASNDDNDEDLEQLETASEVFCKLIQVHDHVIVISERKRPQFFFVSAACSSKMKRYNIAEVTIWALAALATLHSTNCLGKSFYLLHFLIKKKSSFLLFVDFRKTIRPLFPQISKCQMIS